jgi:hypothetical protein
MWGAPDRFGTLRICFGKGVDRGAELTNPNTNTESGRLNDRLNDIAWGLLLIMTGIIWLVPKPPEGVWLIGVAVILLGINMVRYFKHVRVNGFSLGLGLAALIAAFAPMWLRDVPLLAICLLVIGASLIAKPLLRRAT